MRGGSRGGKSGVRFSKDVDTVIQPPHDFNLTLFEFLQNGCFEKDLLTYCANRLTDYTCVFWMNKETLERQKLPAGFKAQHDAAKNLTHLTAGERYNLTTLLSSHTGVCYQDSVSHTGPLIELTRILVPIFLLLGLMVSVLIFLAMWKLGHTFLPLCIYLSYLALFDIVDLILRGGDLVVESFFRIRLVSAVQLLNGSACQMFPMSYNIFKHIQGALYIGLAIDTWRFVREPMRMFGVYRKEWTRNVFIVSAAVLITINGQFFWTFDITEHEKTILHGREIKQIFECGFSTTLPLDENFVLYIWPIIDFLAGEFLPFIFTLIFGILCVRHQLSHKPNHDQLSRFLINTDFVLRINRTFSAIIICFALFMLPRLIYIFGKFIIFTVAPKLWEQPPTSNPTQTQEKKSTWIENYRGIEPKLEIIEYVAKSLGFVFILVKFIVLFVEVPLFRNLCFNYCTFSCVRKKKNDSQSEQIVE